MKEFKKIIAIGLTFAMGLSLCACGDSKKKGDGKADILDEEAMEENMPEVEGDPIFVYSFNGELGEKLQYFYELYPEYKSRVEFVNLELGATSKEYQDTIKRLMKEGTKRKKKKVVEGEELSEEEMEGELPKYPSIVANDSIMGYSFIQNDYSVPVSSLGITEEDMQNMYPYTLSAATFQDEVKGLAWGVTPGAFLYRVDIAEKVLGESSPEAVQEMLANWSEFLKVAKKMKKEGYKILSGSDEITYAMLQNRHTAWVEEEKLRIDSNVKKCLELSKQLQEEEYAGDTLITSNERKTSFGSDVFGWFVYPGMIYEGMETGGHAGDFRLCQGPNPYQWGNTYLTVSPQCPDKELAALVLKTLCCNEEVLAKMAQDEVVNHKGIMDEQTQTAEGLEVLGGQKPLEIWTAVADSIDAERVTPYDGRFDSWIQELSVSFNRDEIEDIKKVFDQFKDKVSDTFNYIVVK
ncbi:MAG: extracellular solute-binding protein [Clostridiales bacterium]|nr:extracellular solute-binding protein [Clostridiales bacterium]